MATSAFTIDLDLIASTASQSQTGTATLDESLTAGARRTENEESRPANRTLGLAGLKRVAIAGLDGRSIEALRSLSLRGRVLIAVEELALGEVGSVEAWLERGLDVASLEATLRARFGERVRVIERAVDLRVALRTKDGEARRRAFEALVRGALRARVEAVSATELVLVLRLAPELAHAGYVLERVRPAGLEASTLVELARAATEHGPLAVEAALGLRALATFLLEDERLAHALVARGVARDAATGALLALARRVGPGANVREDALERDARRSAAILGAIEEEVAHGELGRRLAELVDAVFATGVLREAVRELEARASAETFAGAGVSRV